MHIDFAYFNYEHGGRVNANSLGDGGPYDFRGLVRVMGEDDRWADAVLLGEGDRYEYNGLEGAWEAAAAMREAGGRAYTPLPCSLPREWGPFAPVIFVDLQKIVVRRFYSHRLPDFAARNRNLVVFKLPGRPDSDVFHLVATHGDPGDDEARVADAKALRPRANPDIPCLIGGDFNATPSGWEPPDINDRAIYDLPYRYQARAWWHPGLGEHVRFDTRSLDYLVGSLDRSQPERSDGIAERSGGIGFHAVAELEGDRTPTTLPVTSGRACTTIDWLLVNKPAAAMYVPGSYRVHEPLDPENPDSDHKRVSATLDI
jgi:endonuclease/exonuclease/phosphatase family metal-dependent hydrolase